MNENYCKKVLNRDAKCVILRDKVPCFHMVKCLISHSKMPCFARCFALFHTMLCLVSHDALPQISLLLIINNVNTSN